MQGYEYILVHLWGRELSQVDLVPAHHLTTAVVPVADFPNVFFIFLTLVFVMKHRYKYKYKYNRSQLSRAINNVVPNVAALQWAQRQQQVVAVVAQVKVYAGIVSQRGRCDACFRLKKKAF